MKKPILRDRKYLNWLREQRCIITGMAWVSSETVDPVHIGTAGKGIKSPDDQALPIRHSIHQEMHSKDEISTLRCVLPDDVLRAALRAYARELYQQWKAEQ